MSKKLLGSVLFVFVILLFLGATTSRAEDPTSLIVVRAEDDSLWKATCVETTCTSFTSFPGLFGSQPTVYWDEGLKRYVLWGRASNGSVWRSTFTSAGTFNNDWVSIPGSTASPVGAAGSTLLRPIWGGNYGESKDASTLSTCDTYTNLSTLGLTVPRAGFVVVTASGIYSPTLADKYVRVCIADTSAGSSCDSWSPVLESTSANFTGYGAEKRYTLQKWYYVSTPGTTKWVYLKACKEAGATGTLFWNDVSVNFQVGD
jgi:hypothetical protein